MELPVLFFIVIAAISVAAAVGVVGSRVPVHSALFLLSHFVTLAILYITLDAQFLAAAQVIVYAGGIVILILFVIMLIGSEQMKGNPPEKQSFIPHIGATLGLILLGAITYSMQQGFVGVAPNASGVEGGVPTVVGVELFAKYILPVELVAVLLLVALLGAMLLARHYKTEA